MRQKYIISRSLKKEELRILEYAVVDKDLKKITPEQLRKDDFSLMSEEVYRSEKIIDSISLGNSALIATLRTHNIFPIGSYAKRIAETIVGLYDFPDEDGSVELYFDDKDSLKVNQET